MYRLIAKQIMFNLFDNIKTYGEKWVEVEGTRRSFNEKEIASIDHTEVCETEFGLSLHCYLHKDSKAFKPIDISKFSSLEIGDTPDLKDLEVFEVEKEGKKKTLVIEKS